MWKNKSCVLGWKNSWKGRGKSLCKRGERKANCLWVIPHYTIADEGGTLRHKTAPPPFPSHSIWQTGITSTADSSVLLWCIGTFPPKQGPVKLITLFGYEGGWKNCLWSLWNISLAPRWNILQSFKALFRLWVVSIFQQKPKPKILLLKHFSFSIY